MKKLEKENVSNVLALTPMQEGILFHYLKEPGSALYFEQLCLELSGAVEKEIFEKAWNSVIQTNEMLRTLFRWEKINNPVQVILKQHSIKPRYYNFSNPYEAHEKTSNERGSSALLERPTPGRNRQAARPEKIKAEDGKEGFDLRDVPFRITLCKHTDRRYTMIISHHHILYDGWSNGIILKEFFRTYNDFAGGKKTAGPIKTPFETFIKWSLERDTKKEKEFWKHYLSGPGPQTEFALKGKKNKEADFITETYRTRLKNSLCKRADLLAGKHKITPAALLYGAWGLLLQRYNNSGDVIFGTTVSGRNAGVKGIEDMVGLFINTIPLRINTGENGEKIEFLQQVEEALRRRQEFAGTSLVKIKEYGTGDGNEELFDTIVVIENYPLDKALVGKEGALTVDSFSMAEMSHYDLTVGITLFKGIEINITYGKRLFEKEGIVRLAEHFKNILKDLIRTPRQSLSTVKMMSDEERKQVLVEFNDTATDYPREKTIHQLFEEQEARTPDRMALVGEASGGPATRGRVFPAGSPKGGATDPAWPGPWNPNASGLVPTSHGIKGRVQLSYKELNRESDRLAALLQREGVERDTLVAIMVERSVEMIIGLLGILKAGGAYLPIDPGTPEDRIDYMMADSDTKIMLVGGKEVTESNEPTVGNTGEQDREAWSKKGIEIIDLSALNTENRQERDGCREPAGFDDRPSARQCTSSLAYIIYTSGTTGRPKAVMVEHGSVVRLVADTDYIDFKRYGSLLQTGTLSFDASTFEIWGALENGLTLYVVEKDDILSAGKLKEIVSRYGIDVMWMTSALFNHHVGEDVGIFKSIKHLLVGGDVVSPVHVNRLRKEFPGIRVTNGYGPTENTTFSTCLAVEREYHDTIPIGAPISNSTAYIVDGNGRPCPIGVPGELLVGGDGLARGYLNHPELTAERFIISDGQKEKHNLSGCKQATSNRPAVQDKSFAAGHGPVLLAKHNKSFWESGTLFSKRVLAPGGNTPPRVAGPPEAPVTDGVYYKTGDLARWLPDGNIEFLGRIDSQVKIRGFRIELGEIEGCLSAHPGIREAVVLASGDDSGDKFLCAYFTVSPDSTDSEGVPGLREYVSGFLPDYMIPSHFIEQEKIPLTANGKVDRKALAQVPVSNLKFETYVAPRNEMEKKLVGIWADVLAIPREGIGIDVDFFQMGGHSLKATVLAARIHKGLDIKLSLDEIFKNATIRAQADLAKGKAEERFAAITRVEKKDFHILSSAQKRLYFLQQMDAEGTAYNMPHVTAFPGAFSREKVEETFKQLIRRHESLRTSFHMKDGVPVQVVHENVEFEIEYPGTAMQCRPSASGGPAGSPKGGAPWNPNASDLIPTLQGGDLPAGMERSFFRPFDLSKAPLLRVGIVETNGTDTANSTGDVPGERLLLIDMHHIITDGTSQEILINEFNGLNRGETLPPLTLQYKDYAAWRNGDAQKEFIKQQEEYWMRQLSGERPVLNLPTDYPRPLRRSFEGDNLSFALNPENARTLTETAKENDSTLYMVVLSIFTIVLSKLSGQEDIIIGTPEAGRRHADLENIVGMFVNTLVMRNYPQGEKSFKTYLGEVKENTLAAFENREYPFDDLVDRVSVRRDTGRNPIFDVMFSYLDLPSMGLDISGKAAKSGNPLPGQDVETTSKFDLTLDLQAMEGEYLFSFEYCVKLFKKETIQRFIGYFENTIAGILNNREIKIMDIDILSEEEKKRLIFDFNGITIDYPRDKTLHGLFEEQVERTPSNTALIDYMEGQRRSLTYGQLNEKASALTGLLMEKGFMPQSIAGIKTERSIEMPAAILAVLKAGGAYVPIASDCPSERSRYIIEDSNMNVLLTTRSQAKTISFDKDIVYLEEVCLEEVGEAHGPDEERSVSSPGTGHSASDPAYVIYTSGTTGRPKGVVVEHRNVVAYLEAFYREVHVEARHTILQQAAFTFDVFVEEMFALLLRGGAIAISPGEIIPDMEKLSAFIRENNVNIIDCSPLLLNQINESGDISGLEICISGGDVLKEKYINRLLEACPVYNVYGPTETTIGATFYRCGQNESLPGKIPIGRPFANYVANVLDKHGKLSPMGVPGELCITGPGVARGYLNNPELTAERFINAHGPVLLAKHNKSFAELFQKRPPGGPPEATLYKTGDLVRWLPDGNIEFLGRIDHQVKIRGFRIELGEIESCLSAHPGVKEAAVIICGGEASTGDSGDIKNLCAYYVPVAVPIPVAGPIPEADLSDYLSQFLPDYMIPTFYFKLETIPLTVNGKIDRNALSEFPISNFQLETYTAPRDETEETLAEIWADVLEIQKEDIGIDDGFFNKGGHSLNTTILAAKIHKAFNVRLSLREIFKDTSIRKLAVTIKEMTQETFAAIPTAEKKAFYVLSSAQKRLYILQQMELAGTTYNMPHVTPLPETVSPGELETVFKQLIQRHESLRTSFHMINETPVQVVHENVEFKIDYYQSVVKKDAPPCAADFYSIAPADAKRPFFRPFDLSAAPLFRVGIVEPTGTDKESGQRFMLLDMHHIITDGTSQDVLIEEFNDLIQGGILPPLTLKYKDYSEWLNSSDQKQLVKEQEEFWLDLFCGELPVLDLPTDYPRPVVRDFEGSRDSFVLNEEETNRFKETAKEHEVTLYMAILSVFTILLSKLSGQEDIIVGTATAGRRHADLENIIGMFVNTLAVRNNVPGEKSFKAFLEEVKENTLKAFDNQEYQFEDLVDRLSVRRDTGRNPLFDVMLNVLNQVDYKEQGAFSFGTVPGDGAGTSGNEPWDVDTAKFDLTLYVIDAGERLDFHFIYGTKLFKAETIKRFITYFKGILQTVCFAPDGKIKDIEIITEEEKNRILYEFNDTASEYPRDKTIHQLFEEQAARTPDRVALVGDASGGPAGSPKGGATDPAWPGPWNPDASDLEPAFNGGRDTRVKGRVQLSYKELNGESNRLATLLQRKGVGPDTLVAIMAERSVEMIIGLLGILKAGGAYLPIDPEYPEDRINYMMADSHTKIMLVGGKEVNESNEPPTGNPGELDEEGWSKKGIEVIDLNALSTANRQEKEPADVYVRPSARQSASSLAYIIYTSGTTGRPKAVMVEHWNVVRLVINTDYIDFKRYDSLLQTGTLSFDASTFEIWGALENGLTLYIVKKDDILSAGKFKELVSRYGIDIMLMTTALFQHYVQEAVEIFKSIRHILFGGEVVSPIHVNRFREECPGVRVTHCYGPTENTTLSTCLAVERDYFDKTPIGVPIANSTAYIVDKHGRLCPIGVSGELLVGGDGLARGYLNHPELTAERFIKAERQNKSFAELFQRSANSPEGNTPPRVAGPPEAPVTDGVYYKSGDLARWLPDGNIEFLGRIDHQVKIRGFRIEMGEIENRISSHPGINEAVVLARGEASEGKFLCAYFVVGGDWQPGTNLKRFLDEFLPDYMIPSYFVEMEKMPLTPNGKVDRKALANQQISHSQSEKQYTAPRNEAEEKLSGIWADILDLETQCIGIDDNFFDLGGHSLRATIMVSKIHKEFSVKIPLAEVFKHSSIRELAAMITGCKEDKYSALEPVEKQDHYGLSSAQKRIYFLQQMDANSTAYNMPIILPLTPDSAAGASLPPAGLPAGQRAALPTPRGGALGTPMGLRAKVEAAFRQLIRRHESLRTAFELPGEEPIQRIHDTVDFEVEYYDLTGDGTTSLESIVRDFVKPFDLSRAPLLRSRFIKLPEEKNILLVDTHHIISDGTSHMILAEDFFSYYNGKELKPLKLQYKDFCGWQNRVIEEGELKTQEDYWLELFQGEIPELNLFTDYKRPAVFTFDGAKHRMNLEPEDTAAFRALAADCGGTLYMNLLAALNTLFYKYSGQNDIIIGSGVAGRPHADLQHIVGMFVNTLAMRNYPQEDKGYRSFLTEVVDNSIQAFQNQDVQFEELVDKLEVRRNPARNPLFDLSMVVQNFRQSENTVWNDGAGGPVGTENIEGMPSTESFVKSTAKFDITFFIAESADDFQIEMEYYTGIFKPATIQRLETHFKNLVKAVIGNPDITLKDIDILSEKEKHQLLYEWNDTDREYSAHKTIHQLFEEQVERSPDGIAAIGPYPSPLYGNYSAPVAEVTYRQLNRDADRIALYLLHQKNIQPGDRVGILMSQCLNRLAAVFGVLKAGAVYVPLAPDWPLERLQFMINDAGINIVLSRKNHLRVLNRLQWECQFFHSYLCTDSHDIHAEEESEKSELMDIELWNNVGETATDDITGGGWISSYTGDPFSQKEMDEFGDNVLTKLKPLLHKNMRVLEIGCASGFTMFRIAPEVKEYVGTDLSRVIIEKNKKRVKQEGIPNIKLACLAAHEIDQVSTDDSGAFDLVIINSVIQGFPGHNHLRNVIRKAVALMGDKGYVFVGDVMDQQLKRDLEKELTEFKYANMDKDFTTKTDHSAELFVHKGFWQCLRRESREIETVAFSSKIYTVENELTKFRYDVLLTTDKTSSALRSDNGDAGASWQKYQEDLRALPGGEADHGCDLPADLRLNGKVEPTAPAYIIYTSGSTGTPKGVLLSHRNVVAYVCGSIERLNPGPDDTRSQISAFTFDHFVEEVYPTLSSGGKVFLVTEDDTRDIPRLAELTIRHRITVMSGAPAVLKLLAHCPLSPYMRQFIAGGDTLKEEDIHVITRKVALYNYYGPTEATVSASFFSFSLYGNSGEVLQAISIGKPMDNYRIYILDQNKKTVPVGVNGELCIAGPAIAAGYLNQPELTADTFIDYHLQAPDAGTNTQPEGPSGFQGEPPLGLPGGPPEAKLYKTGDLARRLPDGNIEFLGRIDHQVKIRGFRMELGEIERCLAAHPNIKEAVVLSRESNDGNNFLCAYYVETGTGQQSVAGLKDFLSQSLPDYMIPPFFIKLETIPLTGNGKIDRKALGRLQLTKHKSQKNYTAPRDETEEKLNLIWAGILGTPKQAIGIDDNFFDIGGHSLRATVMVSKIHKEFNVKVPLPEIFANPSIRALADNLKGVNEETYHSIEPAEKKEYYVLSSAQKRLYILEQMESMAYNMPGTVPLAGETDPAKLEAALKTLIQRHDSFRTSFHMINETPVQVVHDTVPFTIEKPASFDRSTADPLTAAKRAFFRPFDLSKAPLLRVGFVETPGGQKENPGRYMLLDMHHIITDGVSREILTREFFALIAGEELPPLTVQYRDYAQWRAGSAQKQLMEQQEEFWLNTFPDELPVLELPTDYPRPVIQSFEGKRVSFVLTQEETRSLNAAANENEATLYMTVLAIFTILLSRLGGREDIIVGAPTAGRRHADLDNIIGMFVNTLAMRNYPEGEKTVGAFLGEVRENTLNVFENQEYQFEDLVDKLSLRRDTGRNPIFDVMFNMLNLDEYDPQDTTLFLEEPENDADGALSSAYVLPGEDFSKFDLTLTAMESGDRLNCQFEYSTKLFKDETIKRFEGYFRRLIHSIATGSINGKIKDLEIITEEEMNRILHEFNDTATDYPQDKTIHQLFQEQAARTPDRVALVGDASGGPAGSPRGGSPWNPNASARVKGRVQTTYRQLDRESDRLAALLQNNGVAPDTIVAIMAERSVEMIIGLLTIVKAGGAYLPIDSDTPADRMLYMLADSQAKIMLTGQTGEPGADELRKKGIEIIDLSQMSNRRQGGKEPAGFNVEPSSRQSASLLAYVMYTSGTTGRPKAVMVEHRSVVRLVVNTGYIDFKRYRSLLQTGTLSFDASTFEIWGALENGLTLYLVKKDDILSVENLKQNVNTYGIDVMWMTSALFNNHIREDIGIFESIKHLLVGGDVVSPVHVNRLREEYPGIRVTNGYGPTENTTFSTCMPVERDYFDKIPIGGPISNSTAYIVDSNSRLCPIGVPGELLVGGDGLARGYLNHPELTAESFIETGLHIKSFAELFQKRPPGGNTPPRVAGPPEAPVTDGIYYRTGDLTRWQPDGTIEFLGRIDSQVKIRGFRIELAEIETRLLTYPGVVEAVVLARQSQSGEKYLCAYYVAESPLSPEAGLKDHLAQYLPDYMVPSHFVQQEKFPLTPNGKVDRKALSRLAASRFQAPTYTAPRNETEKKLVEIWAEVLELNDEKISVDTDFFQIGGHSLRATILATRINKAFNVSIPLAQVFQAPTMEKLARYIDTMPQKKTTHEKDDSLVLLRSMVPPDAPTQHEASLNLRGGFEVGEKHSRANGCTSMVPPARGAAGGSSPCTPNKPSAENLFLVHDGSGDLEGYVAFCNLLNPTFNCWGIRATPMEDCAPQNRAIEDIAGTYIDKIAKIQPEGPYRIVGWSIGGTIAFEMVRQLEQKNKQIAFFGMIDSMAPKPANHPSQKADPFSVEAEWDWVKDHLPATGPDTDIETELKRVKDVRSFWSIIVRYLSEMDIQTLRQSIPEAYRMVIPNFEGQGVEGVISYVNMIRTMSNAGDRYLPADKIKTPVHFFGASETGISGQKDWNKYLEQPFTYYQIEGDHFSILKPPLVNAFARQFNSVMP